MHECVHWNALPLINALLLLTLDWIRGTALLVLQAHDFDRNRKWTFLPIFYSFSTVWSLAKKALILDQRNLWPNHGPALDIHPSPNWMLCIRWFMDWVGSWWQGRWCNMSNAVQTAAPGHQRRLVHLCKWAAFQVFNLIRQTWIRLHRIT